MSWEGQRRGIELVEMGWSSLKQMLKFWEKQKLYLMSPFKNLLLPTRKILEVTTDVIRHAPELSER